MRVEHFVIVKSPKYSEYKSDGKLLSSNFGITADQ